MLRANLRILTSDHGLNNYSSIPLQGKTRYKLANAIGVAQTFSVIACTVDNAKPNTVVRRGATEQNIMAELQWLSEIVIESATGAIHVNVAPVEKKSYGKGTLEAAGGVGTAGILKNVFDLGSTLYSWYSPSKDAPEFEFALSAREGKATKFVIRGEASLGTIAEKLGSAGAFRPDLDIGKNIYEELKAENEFKGAMTGTLQGATSAFKWLFK